MDRAGMKDSQADDPTKRTAVIDSILKDQVDIGGTASLADVSSLNTRQQRQWAQEEEDRRQEALEQEKLKEKEERDQNQKYFVDP
jgi:hypothetical protein